MYLRKKCRVYLKTGARYQPPCLKRNAVLPGVFTGPDDLFYRNRHLVRVTLRPGSSLKTMDGQVSPRKTDTSFPHPQVRQFTDMKSGKRNSTLTPGAPAIVRGGRLKFDPDDPEQGAFFMNEKNQLTRVPEVLTNNFSRLVFMVPADLPPGVYRFVVKSKLNTRATQVWRTRQYTAC